MANSLISFSKKRAEYGGRGYIAGQFPGVLTVDGTPAERPIELRLRDFNRRIIEKVYSNSLNGTYHIPDLDPYTKFDLVARDEPGYLYNDVIIGGIWPWTDSEIILHGPPTPAALGGTFTRVYELTGGVLPYTISGTSMIPTTVDVTLTGRTLTITSAGETGDSLQLIIEDSGAVTKTIIVASTPFFGVDPFSSNVAILMHFDNVNNSTVLTDSAGNIWTVFGNAKISSADSVFGLTSLALDGTGDYARFTPAARFNTQGDFTIEARIKQTAAASDIILCMGGATSVNAGHYFGVTATGQLYLNLSPDSAPGGSPMTTISAAGVISTNTWYSVAAVKTGLNVSLYVDGNLVQTGTLAEQPEQWVSGHSIFLGCYYDGVNNMWTGYIDELRVTMGAARYSSSYVPATSPFSEPEDTSWESVSSLVRMNGGPDETGKVYIGGDGAATSTTEFRFDGASGYFDGSGDYIYTGPHSDLDFGTGDYTIECWIRPNGLGERCLFDNRGSGIEGVAIYSNLDAGGSSTMAIYNGSAQYMNAGAALVQNVWSHVALTREAGQLRVFVNGVLYGTATDTRSYGPGASTYIASNYTLVGQWYAGYIDEIRITKGIARYTAAFTPPQGKFPYPAFDPYWINVVSSLSMNGEDTSTVLSDTKGKTWSVVGNTQIDTSQYRFGPSACYFDGTGDYASCDHPDFAVGGGDFTFEGWFYLSALTSNRPVISISDASSGSGSGWSLFGYGSSNDCVRFFDNPSGLGYNGITPVTANQWHHIAVSRSGSTLRVFLNGVTEITQTISTNYSDTLALIGANRGPAPTQFLNGWLDDLRFTKGVARYTANFAPPVFPYPQA